MDLELEGHVAVVTGASRGIGLAVTRALVREGVRVVAGARSTRGLHDIDGVLAVAVDLAAADGPASLVQHAVDQHGRLDHLVNSVGGLAGRDGDLLSIPDERWQRALDVNFLSAVRASRAAMAHLAERGGSVVNISSINATSPMPPLADYAAAKAALTSFSKSLSMEVGRRGVRVNTLSPGPTVTSMWDGADEAMMRTIADQSSLGRFSEPEHVADAVLFLLSARSVSITGSDLVVDAGQLPVT